MHRSSAAHSPPTPPVAPERPNLDLVGTIAGGDEGMAIFIDQTTQEAVRLRTGQDHLGWIFNPSIVGRRPCKSPVRAKRSSYRSIRTSGIVAGCQRA